ncbi:MAG: hypothetical protein Q4A07_00215 [Coriobacteriales bacterium]|nr:hypothetical protein [Coriobacteriales bacterium]
MRYNKLTTACCGHGVSMLIAGGVVLMPASSAYAATLDELVNTVKSSTSLTFGAGAAAGAVVAGLLGVIVHIRSKRKLKKRIESLEQDAESAKRSMEDAQSRLQELQTEYEAFQQSVVGEVEEAEESPDEGQDNDDIVEDMPAEVIEAAEEQEEESEQEEPSEAIVEEPGDDQPVEEEPSLAQPIEDQTAEDAVIESNEAQETVDADENTSVSFAHKKTVKVVLEERLAPDALNEGASRFSKHPVYTNEIPAFLGHRRARQYDPVVRASLIDQRVPRFDESLFPDVVSHVHNEVDVFEAAMRALEDTLQHTAVLGIEEEEPPLFLGSESKSRPEMLDAAAYVDYLYQEEVEKTKSGEPLTTNHPHLTMFDGTGDLNASKKLGKHHPDHMRLVQNEG